MFIYFVTKGATQNCILEMVLTSK